MTPSEKERIIVEGFDAIRKVYNLRDDLLADAGKLEAVKESNRKLSDRVANLEVTIKALDSAIDKKDVEIKRLNNRLKSRDDAMLTAIEALEENRDAIFDKYLELAHKSDADEEIMRHMIADNRKKKEEIKNLREELYLLQKAHTKLCGDYNSLRKITVTEANFHELRQKLTNMYTLNTIRGFSTSDFTEFAKWFTDTFGDFGINDEEE